MLHHGKLFVQCGIAVIISVVGKGKVLVGSDWSLRLERDQLHSSGE